ncbi:MAG: four helix bundle protein [Candidatus Acidiferrales bacterium]
MLIRTFRDLDVFRESYAAALDISKLTKAFPGFEQFELARQLRRAARAIGSCDEVKLWLEMSKDEGYASKEAIKVLMDRFNRIGAMLASLWKHWRNGE